MADYSCYCYLDYDGYSEVGVLPLKLVSKEAKYGSWDPEPPATISRITPENRQLPYFRLKDGTLTGSEGTVVYEGKDGTRFTLRFADPYWGGDNSAEISSTRHACTAELSSGCAPADPRNSSKTGGCKPNATPKSGHPVIATFRIDWKNKPQE